MLEPASPHLQKLLADLRLCSPRDLRRCRSRVRRLSRDLPAFDTVWIDALLQARKLTSFQARLLDSAHPEHLKVGPCVLFDRLGRGNDSETFLARLIEGNERLVLKQIALAPEELRQATSRLDAILAAWAASSHPSIVVPHAYNYNHLPAAVGGSKSASPAVHPESPRLIIVSRFVSGPHLAELVIRRGRFPAAIVTELMRQLLDGLAALESRGIPHGDLRLTNVRLSAEGVAVLVDAAVATAVRPELIVRPGASPDRYDGTAPELIGTGNHPTAVSDLYGLGCLLWQLLAGRPPFPTGDPLAKLAAHQTRNISDVRQWAPDTPTDLAETILALTRRDPGERPQSARELLARWNRQAGWAGPPRRSGQQKLRNFAEMFQSLVSRTASASGNGTGMRWTLTLALLFAISGAAVSLFDLGARSQLLALATRLTGVTGHPPVAAGGTVEDSGQLAEGSGTSPRVATHGNSATLVLQPLPAPDAAGLILLNSPGPYAAAEISTVGPLVIRGSEGTSPEIVIADKPLKIWAEQLTLQNVHVRGLRENSAAETSSTRTVASDTGALLLAETQAISVSSCSFRTGVESVEERRAAGDGTHTTTINHPLATNPPAPTDGRRSRLEPATVAAGLPGRLGRTAPGGKPARPAAIAWKPIDDRDPQGRRLLIRDSVFTGVHAALFLAGQPREVRVINCLGIEAGALIALGGTLQPSPLPQAVSGQLRRPPQAVSNQRRLPLQVVVQRVTLRESGPLLRFYPDDKAGPSGPVAIQADDCVFDIGVSATALLEVRTETPAGEWLDRVTIQGAGSLITPNANIASRIAPSDGGREVIDASKMELEGLMAAPFEFAGPPSHDPSTSVIVSAQAPRRSSQLPGVDTSSLRVPPLH